MMRAVLLVATFVALHGCGYKGPLYLPESKTAAAKPVTVITPEPAPDRPLPAQSAPAPK